MSLLLPDTPPAPQDGVRRRAYPFRAVRAADASDDGGGGGDDRLWIEGYASVWGSRNSWGEVFVPGAYTETLKAKSASKPLVMGYQHREVIGRWTRHEQDADGLLLGGPVSRTRTGEDVETLVRDGAITGLSIGFWPVEETLAEPGEKVTFTNELGTFSYQFDRWTFYILQADLKEASLVMAPSDDDARLTKARALCDQAARALPALRDGACWEDTAYSMALLMGGRGAAAFADVADSEHRALYERLAAGYHRHGRTAPPYERQPDYQTVNFAHDERELFLDRSLRKALADVDARLRGISGPLSADTRTAAETAAAALSARLAPATGADSGLLERIHADLAATRAAIT